MGKKGGIGGGGMGVNMAKGLQDRAGRREQARLARDAVG